MNLDLKKSVTFNGVELPFITLSAKDREEYKGLKDMYFGSGGFKDGTYLIQHPRETVEFYEARQKLAHYENTFATELEASVGPIFSKDQNREVVGTGSDIIEGFLKNPTKRNESMSEFMNRLELDTSLYGSTFLIADGPSMTPEQGGQDGGQQFNPYTYYLTPTQITGYNMDDKGAINLLVFPQSVYHRTGAKQSNSIVYRVFLKNVDESGVTFQVLDEKVIAESIEVLQEFPVLLSEDNNREVSYEIAKSRYLAIFSVAKKMYNLDSEIDDGFFKTCFAFLAINGKVPENIDLSNANSFQYIGEKVNKPEYVVPPTGHLVTMDDKVTKLRTNIKEDMNSTVVISSEASGDSRTAADKRRIERMVVKSKDLRDTELWLINTALRNFVGGEYLFNVVYITDFESLTKTDELTSLQSLIDSGVLAEQVKAEIGLDMITISYSNDPTRRDYLIDLQESKIKEMALIPLAQSIEVEIVEE